MASRKISGLNTAVTHGSAIRNDENMHTVIGF